MTKVTIIENGGQRVLTTSQLAESYGAEKQLIINNFNRNKERYVEGKHFIALQGKEKNGFINLNQIELGSKKAQTLYLWTEKGAWLHAKSLNTDAAWDAYEMLVDDYFKLKEENKRLANDNKTLHKIAISDDEQSQRQYQADKVRYSWKNIRTVLESCDYKTIENEVAKVIEFHTNDLKKKDRANYDSHIEANKTEYKQIVRERVFGILEDITNMTHNAMLRVVAGELRVDVMRDKIGTINRKNGAIQSELHKVLKSIYNLSQDVGKSK